jgi:hypothetical protein
VEHWIKNIACPFSKNSIAKRLPKFQIFYCKAPANTFLFATIYLKKEQRHNTRFSAKSLDILFLDPSSISLDSETDGDLLKNQTLAPPKTSRRQSHLFDRVDFYCHLQYPQDRKAKEKKNIHSEFFTAERWSKPSFSHITLKNLAK